MNFKRSHWRLFFISLGCLVLGFVDWMLVTPDFKNGPDLQLWVFVVGEIFGLFGAIGIVWSLIWMLVAGVGLEGRAPRSKRRGAAVAEPSRSVTVRR